MKAKARRSSSNDWTEQTLLLPLHAATWTMLFVANSHFFNTRDSNGNSGCLTANS